MKILHIAQMIQGGVASHLCEMLPHQIARFGIENVTVLVAEDQVVHLEGIPEACIARFPSSRRDAAGLLGMAAAARKAIARERPDIVHLHSTFAGAVIRLAALVPPWRRYRTVYCAHGWSFNMCVSETKRNLYGWLERALAPLADAITCISQYELKTAAERGLPAAKLYLLYNGIKPLGYQGGDTGRDAAGPVDLLYIGRQDEQKGFDTLAAAMRQLDDTPIHLHAVGASVVSNAQGLVPQRNITQHGWQPRERIPEFIANADAVIVPSRWEGFGLVAIEAMRQGRAVCASNVDALPELVADGETGFLFPPDKPEALAALLASLDRDTLGRLGRSGHARYLALFTADRMNQALMDIYANVLRKR